MKQWFIDMIYVFIDESGNLGRPGQGMTSDDFSMVAIICPSQDIEFLIDKVKRLVIRIKKKEIKFSKLSTKEVRITNKFLDNLNIKYVAVYSNKTDFSYGEMLLRKVFSELILNIKISQKEKIKVFIDGTENAYFRKIYEPVVRKKFPRASVKFANSIKTPMIQVADFYAGYYRKSKGVLGN